MNVQLSISIYLYISLFCCNCFFCHINNYYLVAFFLLATVFFLPLRVRALFLTYTTVATDIHQTFNIQLNLRAKITFYFVLCANDLTNLGSLIIRPVFYFQVSVNTCFIQNFC